MRDRSTESTGETHARRSGHAAQDDGEWRIFQESAAGIYDSILAWPPMPRLCRTMSTR
jgi:hypothetical protein